MSNGQFVVADGAGQRRGVVLWELVQTAHLAERRFAEVFAQHGLSSAQYGVLASLADGDDLSQADLARAVLVRPQSIARVVSTMVDAGLVTRDGVGGRGRRTGLGLTPRGRSTFEAVRPAARAVSRPAAVGLTPDEAAVLLDLLRTLRDTISSGASDPAISSESIAVPGDDGDDR